MRDFKFSGVFILIAISIIAGCSSSRGFPGDYNGDQIHFGQGGGFTGNVNYYVILEDGRLFQKQQRDSSYTHLATWKKNFTKQLFTNYQQLSLDTLAFNEPGNLYYFVEMH